MMRPLTNANGRKIPRQPRWIPRDTMTVATSGAAKLTRKEVNAVVQPARAALIALREGKATRTDYVHLCSCRNVGYAIEDLRVVKGFQPILDAGDKALNAIASRAFVGDVWLKSPTLHSHELVALDDLVNWHATQMLCLSYSEHQAAYNLAVSRVRSGGGKVFNPPPKSIS